MNSLIRFIRKKAAQGAAFPRLFWIVAIVLTLFVLGAVPGERHTQLKHRLPLVAHNRTLILHHIGLAEIPPMDTPFVQSLKTALVLSDRNRYFRRMLPDPEKVAYDALLSCVRNHEDRVEGVQLSSIEDLERVARAMYHDHPELIWYDGGYDYYYEDVEGGVKIRFTPEYVWNPKEAQQIVAYVEASAQPIIDSLKGKSDYEKVRGVYEYLIHNTVYDRSYYGATMYELFRDGRGVCEAYARAAQYLLNELGVETIFVLGFTGAQTGRPTHAWNIVKVDGEYYHMDATWGDPCYNDGIQRISYDYLCVTDESLRDTHFMADIPYPECSSEKYMSSIRN